MHTELFGLLRHWFLVSRLLLKLLNFEEDVLICDGVKDRGL